MKKVKLLWTAFLNLFRKKKLIKKQPVLAQKRVMPGMKVWECDLTTGAILEPEIIITPYVDQKGRLRNKRKVTVRENCIYEYALNGENATRKFEARISNHYKKNNNNGTRNIY